jgi:hypothetical protein
MFYFSPRYMKRWKEEGERGTFFSRNVFFIVEWLGRVHRGFLFFTNSWEGGGVC